MDTSRFTFIRVIGIGAALLGLLVDAGGCSSGKVASNPPLRMVPIAISKDLSNRIVIWTAPCMSPLKVHDPVNLSNGKGETISSARVAKPSNRSRLVLDSKALTSDIGGQLVHEGSPDVVTLSAASVGKNLIGEDVFHRSQIRPGRWLVDGKIRSERSTRVLLRKVCPRR